MLERAHTATDYITRDDEARADLKPARSFVVYSGQDRYPLMEGVEVIGLRMMAEVFSSV